MKRSFHIHRLLSGAALMAIGAGMLMGGAKAAWATPIETDAASTSQNAYDATISTTNDLIYSGSSTLGSSSVTGNVVFGASGINDGIGGNNNTNATYLGNPPPAAGDFATFNLVGSATGYSISKVVSIDGWSNNAFTEQDYYLQVKTLSNNTFTTIATVTYNPSSVNTNSSSVTLTPSSGSFIINGVTAVQFVIGPSTNPLGPGNDGVVVHELEVYGSPTAIVPEPASLGLLGAGAVGLLLLQRRKNA